MIKFRIITVNKISAKTGKITLKTGKIKHDVDLIISYIYFFNIYLY